MNQPKRASLVIAFASVYLAWGSTYLAIRYAIETLPPFLMASARFLIAGCILYLWARLRGAPRPQPRHWRSTLLVGGLLLLGGNGSVVWAEQRIPSGLAALLVAMAPVWIVLVDAAWRKTGPPATRVIGGLILGLAGLALLAGPGQLLGSQRLDLLGVAALIFGSMSWAVGSIYSRVTQLPESTALATGMEMLGGGALLLVAGLLTGELRGFAVSSVSLTSVLAVLYLVIVGSLIGFNAYIWLLGVTTPARATTYAYVNPIVAIFLGWAIVDEPVSLRTLVSAAVIVAGVALIISEDEDQGDEGMRG